VPALARLLARDGTFGVAVTVLAEIGPDVVPLLAPVLRDEAADFVVRRRIPRVLSRIESRDADSVLLEGLDAGRFEVRYRVALALRRRRQRGLPEASGDWQSVIWKAVRAEVSRERPVWELARLLDSEADDGLVERRVGLREPRTVQAAYHGIVLDDPELESFALEYMEQVLPPDIRKRLWPFIGDMSASAERRAIRKLDDVVADLLQTGATLFGTPESREELQRYLRGDGEERPD
jgi:hypothetical protein